MPLTEPLYVDHRRLDWYVNEIGPPPKYVKLPNWEASLSLTGPKAGAKQQAQLTTYSVQEKIAILIDHLEKEHELSRSRPAAPNGEVSAACKKDFVLEECVAKKFIIPPRTGEPESNGLHVWVSIGAESATARARFEAGILCLIEDFPLSDAGAFRGPSGFTVFSALLRDLNDKLKHTIWVDEFPESGAPKHKREYADRFDKDPISTLGALGCRAGIERRIEVLYRVRQVSVQGGGQRPPISTFAYPIYIYARDRKAS